MSANNAPTKIGILGCGVISGIYIENAKKLAGIDLVAVADVNPTAARYRADQYGIAGALTPGSCSPIRRSRSSSI